MQIHEYIIQNQATTTVALNFFNPIVGPSGDVQLRQQTREI